MRLLLWVMLFNVGLAIIVKLCFLAISRYPRTTEYTALVDVLSVVLNVALLVWFIAVFGGQL